MGAQRGDWALKRATAGVAVLGSRHVYDWSQTGLGGKAASGDESRRLVGFAGPEKAAEPMARSVPWRWWVAVDPWLRSHRLASNVMAGTGAWIGDRRIAIVEQQRGKGGFSAFVELGVGAGRYMKGGAVGRSKTGDGRGKLCKKGRVRGAKEGSMRPEDRKLRLEDEGQGGLRVNERGSGQRGLQHSMLTSGPRRRGFTSAVVSLLPGG